MQITNIHDAKTHLSQLIRRAVAGEEIVIGRAGDPQVVLVPYRPAVSERKGGQWRGRVWIAEDFDASDSEIERLFYSDKP